MFISIHEPFAPPRKRLFKTDGMLYKPKRTIGAYNYSKTTIGSMLNSNTEFVEKVLVNGEYAVDWANYVPLRGDKVDVYLKVGLDPGTWAAIIAGLSFVMNVVMAVLAPTPKKPKGFNQETFGISGVQNTTGAGTPKFVIYGGPQRVYPHLIGTRTELMNPSWNGGAKRLKFAALYFCGDTGGDSYEDMYDVEINGTKAEDLENLTYEVRYGTDDQTVIPGFESTAQAFTANLSLPYDEWVVYTTKFTDVERLTFIFAQVLFRQESDGDIARAHTRILIERKLHSEGDESYVSVGAPFEVDAAWTAQTYYQYVLDLPAAGQYDIRFKQNWQIPSTATEPTLFNVQEEVFTLRNYPGSALLAVFGIASNQIQSIESLNTSLLIKGKKVKRPIGGGSTETVWTPQRMWITWDMITHQRVGLGHRIASSFFDTAAAAIEQAYLDEDVTGFDGTEIRDECTVLVNDRKPGWDWIKDSILGEVNGIVFLSGGKLKPALRRPKDPNLLYSYPGNIIEDKGGAIKRSISHLNNTVFNTYRVTFQDREKDYALSVLEVQDSDIGSDPVREDSVQFDTIKRTSQAYRQGQIILRENILSRRRYVFKCRGTALVAEPFDIDTLSLRSFKDAGQSGHVLGGSSTTSLVLDKKIALDDVSTYQVMVRHQKTNIVERLVVTESNGNYLIITPTTPFSYAPEPGDLWAIGRSGSELIDVITMDVKSAESGGYELTVIEYRPEIWTEQALPNRRDRRFFNIGNQPPLPLRSVSVREDLSLNSSGIYESVLYFDVVPGLPLISGFVTLPPFTTEPTNGIYLASSEPANDDFYNRWILRIVDGPGTGQPEVTITDYDGLTRFASCDLSQWTELPTVGSTYEVRKERYGSYMGFFVEIADDPSGPWFEPGGARFLGTSGVLSGPSLSTEYYFRFTPFSNLQVDGLLGRFIMSYTAQGDGGVPADVEGFNVVQMGQRFLFTWNKVADVDIATYEIRIGNEVATTWELAAILAYPKGDKWEVESVEALMVTPKVIALDVYGNYDPDQFENLTAFIKATDWSKNSSVNAASVTFTPLPITDIVTLAERNELLEMSGTFNDTAVRTLSGANYLGLAASTKWDAGATWDGAFYYDTPIVLVGSYTALPLVLPRRGIARARMELMSPNFNGGQYVVEESHSSDLVAYTPYKPTTTGDLYFRSARMRVSMTAESTLYQPLFSRVRSIIEATVRTVYISNKFVPATGLEITHSPPWLRIPIVQITPYTGEPVFITMNTETTLRFTIGSPAVATFASITIIGV